MVFCVEGNKRVSNEKLLVTYCIKKCQSSWLQPALFKDFTAHCSSAGEMLPTHRELLASLTHLQSHFLRHLMEPVFRHTQQNSHFGNSFNTDFVSYFKMLKTEVPASMLQESFDAYVNCNALFMVYFQNHWKVVLQENYICVL